MTDLTPEPPETETDESPPSQPAPAKTRISARMMRLLNRAAVVLAGFLGIAIIVYFILWFYAADKITQGIDRYIAESNAHGNRVTVKSVTTSGFPGKIRVDIEKADAFLFGGDTIRIPSIMAEARAWSWRRVDFALPGGISIRSPNAVLDGISAEHLRGDAFFGRLDGLPVISIEATNTTLSLSPPLITAVTDYRRQILAQKLRLSFAPAPTDQRPDAFRFRLDGDIIGLLDAGATQIGEHTHYIEKVHLNTFLPQPPPVHLSRERLAGWRDAGGEIQVEDIEVTWWPVHMIGGGTAGLDAALQPAGRLDLEIAGFNTLVDMMAAAGLLTGSAQEMAHIALNLLAKRKEGSDTLIINVPLEIRDNALTLGPVRIMRLDPIIWPGEARVIHR